MVNKDLQY